jgi:tRNA modification GTPase
MSTSGTIAAISTAPGRAAIAIIRVSGPGALKVADATGLPRLEARRATHSRLQHPEDARVVDQVLVTYFEAPGSYTGEDMLEIGCHGGPLGPQLVLDAVCAAGARLADRGEFTRRALLNGKLDLLQVEATVDLIDARSPALQRAALFQLERGLSRRVEGIRRSLLDLQALLAYEIDFPEEDEGPIGPERIDEACRELACALDAMLALAPEGELLRDGALTVIAGRPNAGKSSLFNYLLGLERAIVTEVPGTTRDAIEAVVGLDGYPFRLVDTAGLRANPLHVEQMGIEVARAYLARADVILLCVDAGRSLAAEEQAFLEEWREGRDGRARTVVVVRTKTDLVSTRPSVAEAAGATGTTRGSPATPECAPAVRVSVRSGEGIPELRRVLLDAVYGGAREAEAAPLVTRERQVRKLREARLLVAGFREAWEAGLPAEISGTHLQDAAVSLEELLGVVTTEDVLDVLFESFCVGK